MYHIYFPVLHTRWYFRRLTRERACNNTPPVMTAVPPPARSLARFAHSHDNQNNKCLEAALAEVPQGDDVLPLLRDLSDAWIDAEACALKNIAGDDDHEMHRRGAAVGAGWRWRSTPGVCFVLSVDRASRGLELGSVSSRLYVIVYVVG